MNDSAAFGNPRLFDMGDVARENYDLPDRLYQEGLEFAYDEDGDTLIISLGSGEPRDALTEQAVDGVYLRIDPVTLKLVGAVVLSFTGDFLANNKIARSAFGGWFETLRERGTVRIEGEDAK